MLVLGLLIIGSISQKTLGQSTNTNQIDCQGGTWQQIETTTQYICSSTLISHDCSSISPNKKTCFYSVTNTDKTEGYITLKSDSIAFNSPTDSLSIKIDGLSIFSKTTKFINLNDQYFIGFNFTIPSQTLANSISGKEFVVNFTVDFPRDISKVYSERRIKISDKYDYIPSFYCDVNQDIPVSGDIIDTRLKNSSSITYSVNFSVTNDIDGIKIPLVLNSGDVISCYDPIVPSSTQPATSFSGVWYFSNNTGIGGNISRQSLYSTGVIGSAGTQDGMKNGSWRVATSDYSRVVDVGVVCVLYRNQNLELYAVNTTTGKTLTQVQLDSNQNQFSTYDCSVINHVNSSKFSIFYDEQGSDNIIRYRLYNGTGFETERTITYNQPAAGAGNVRDMSVIQGSGSDEFILAFSNNGGTDSFQFLVYNVSSYTELFNWSTGTDIVFNVATSTPRLGLASTGDNRYTGIIYPNASKPNGGTFVTIYDRQTNSIANTFNFNFTPGGQYDYIRACRMSSVNDNIAFIGRTNESDMYAYILNLTDGSENGIVGDTSVEFNGDSVNIGCYEDEIQSRILFMMVDDAQLQMKYWFFAYNSTWRWENNTHGQITQSAQGQSTGNFATDDIREIYITPCPVGDCAMITTADIVSDLEQGAFYDGNILNVSKVTIKDNNIQATNNPFVFLFSKINYAPRTTLVAPNNATLFDSSISIVNLTVNVTDVNGDSINISFINNSNTLSFCQNNSIASGSNIICSIPVSSGTETKWYVNVTDSQSEGGLTNVMTGIWNFSIQAPVVSLSVTLTGNVTTFDEAYFNWTTVGNYTNSTLWKNNSGTWIAIYNGTDKNFTTNGLTNNTLYQFQINVTWDNSLMNTTGIFSITTAQTDVLNNPVNNSVLPSGTTTVILNVTENDNLATGTFYNVSNNAVFCTNTSIIAPTNVTCLINVADGLEIKWYYNSTKLLETTKFGVWNFSVTQPITNTCTYSGSGDWTIDCNDACFLTLQTNTLPNKIIFTGIGEVKINTTIITNFTSLGYMVYGSKTCLPVLYTKNSGNNGSLIFYK